MYSYFVLDTKKLAYNLYAIILNYFCKFYFLNVETIVTKLKMVVQIKFIQVFYQGNKVLTCK